MPIISVIEEIGPRKRAGLKKAGVTTCEALLEQGATRSGRTALAKAASVNESAVLDWVNRADLMRIRGVSSQYADLLAAAGIHNVKELRRSNPILLAAALKATNLARRNRLVKRTPSQRVIESWVEQANQLPAIVKA
jgi:predicted flap endonuclease-1-like 5' DNA nuclease